MVSKISKSDRKRNQDNKRKVKYNPDAWHICPDCRIAVRNVGKHKNRGRCKKQHIRLKIRKAWRFKEKNENHKRRSIREMEF